MTETFTVNHWPYVWACFALTAIVLIVCEWRARRRHRRIVRDIEVRVKALGDTE